jgi:sugar phosphate isomerase/epimerase
MMAEVNDIGRRTFLRVTAGAGAAALMPGCARGPVADAPETPFLSKLGVCTSIDNHAVAAGSGCSYVEDTVGGLLCPAEPRERFEGRLQVLRSAGCPVAACNSFLPGSLKSVGPRADHESVLAYAETAFERAREAGVRTIVFGSGGSRRIPDGFAKGEAERQFLELLGRMAPRAGRYGIVISLEPLNTGETNFINSLADGAAFVTAVNHPNLRLLADIYHMLREDESPDEIVTCGSILSHCHIAEKDGRTPPGVARDDFVPYLRALKQVGYRGRLSIECRWKNFDAELPAAVAYVREQIARV